MWGGRGGGTRGRWWRCLVENWGEVEVVVVFLWGSGCDGAVSRTWVDFYFPFCLVGWSTKIVG